MLDSRLAADKTLLERSVVEGLRLLSAEWDGQRAKRYSDIWPYELDFEVSNGIRIASALVSCRHVEAIEILQRGMQTRSIKSRIGIYCALNNAELLHGQDDPADIKQRRPEKHAGDDKLLRENWNAAVEALFVAALDETQRESEPADQNRLATLDERPPLIVKDGPEKSHPLDLPNPRTCDVAMLILRNLNPAKYAFSDAEFEENPEQVRIQLKNLKQLK